MSVPKIKLFIVPWLQATWLNGLSIKSTNFWEVSTFPPTTAASFDGDKIVPSGIIIARGTRTPEFRGISWPMRDRRQYRTALLVIDLGVFVFARTYLPVPLKSKTAFLFFLSIVSFN